jgi:hypothetical protein
MKNAPTASRAVRPLRAREQGGGGDGGTCPVCHSPFTPSGRFGHLRAEHPAYWRTLLVRLGAPWVFLATMFALATTGAAGWAYIALLIGFVGVSLWARTAAARSRRARGVGLSGGQWIRGAGLGLLGMAIAFTLTAVVLLVAR